MGIGDNKFELLLKEKNHKDLIKKLDTIIKALGEKEAPVEMDLSGIEKAISNITVQNEIDHSVPNAIMALSEVILQKIENINKEEKEWTFKIERDSDGFIEIVKAINK